MKNSPYSHYWWRRRIGAPLDNRSASSGSMASATARSKCATLRGAALGLGIPSSIVWVVEDFRFGACAGTGCDGRMLSAALTGGVAGGARSCRRGRGRAGATLTQGWLRLFAAPDAVRDCAAPILRLLRRRAVPKFFAQLRDDAIGRV